MKKLLVFFGVLFLFVGVVNAKSATLDEYVEGAKDYSGISNITVDTSVSGKLTIDAEGRVLTVDYDPSKGNLLTYQPDSIGSNDTLVLNNLLGGIAQVQGVSGYKPADFRNDIGTYTLENNAVEGTVNSDGKYTYLKLYADCFNLDGSGNTCMSSGGSGSGGSSSEETTPSTTPSTPTENPKTGVFVPIVGISVLIVASVVCLIWISKKSIFKL